MSKESGKFGARYGAKIRRNFDEASEDDSRYEKIAAGVWKDKQTGEKFAGGAHKAQTGAEELMERALEVETEELEEAKEDIEE